MVIFGERGGGEGGASLIAVLYFSLGYSNLMYTSDIVLVDIVKRNESFRLKAFGRLNNKIQILNVAL